jgi:hypothetical protein
MRGDGARQVVVLHDTQHAGAKCFLQVRHGSTALLSFDHLA